MLISKRDGVLKESCSGRDRGDMCSGTISNRFLTQRPSEIHSTVTRVQLSMYGKVLTTNTVSKRTVLQVNEVTKSLSSNEKHRYIQSSIYSTSQFLISMIHLKGMSRSFPEGID